MGLMNVGRTEGTRPPHLSTLETLNIFGIRADYMAQFREFLTEEGLPGNEERIEFFLPVIRNLGRKPLKTIRLKKTINGMSTESGKLVSWGFGGLRAVWFSRHLYEPLLYLSGKDLEIRPAPLNPGERRFVEDLKRYHDAAPDLLKDKALYLLRNQSRGRGVGFFEAGNFHPDFIVWLIDNDHETISFVDPKGIRSLGFQDPKIQFHETVKEIETRLGDPSVTLNSFVISNTPRP